jgi:hypothetical protein
VIVGMGHLGQESYIMGQGTMVWTGDNHVDGEQWCGQGNNGVDREQWGGQGTMVWTGDNGVDRGAMVWTGEQSNGLGQGTMV